MKTLLAICAYALNRTRFQGDQLNDRIERTPDSRPEIPAGERMEIAMAGMSDEDARWYYERLRWRA